MREHIPQPQPHTFRCPVLFSFIEFPAPPRPLFQIFRGEGDYFGIGLDGVCVKITVQDPQAGEFGVEKTEGGESSKRGSSPCKPADHLIQNSLPDRYTSLIKPIPYIKKILLLHIPYPQTPQDVYARGVLLLNMSNMGMG